MNLVEAAKSGRPFKRKDEVFYKYLDMHLYDDLCESDIIADDYEVLYDAPLKLEFEEKLLKIKPAGASDDVLSKYAQMVHIHGKHALVKVTIEIIKGTEE